MSTAPSTEPPATAAPSAGGGDLVDARGELDVIARRLESRRSIDFVKRGALQGFAALIAFGFAARLAWDRWAFARGWTRRPPSKPPTSALPLFFVASLAVFLVLVVLAVRSIRRSRALMRDEDADFARLRALRARLGLDR